MNCMEVVCALSNAAHIQVSFNSAYHSTLVVKRSNLLFFHSLQVPSPFLGTYAMQKSTISFVMSVRASVCLHVTTRLPLDGFS